METNCSVFNEPYLLTAQEVQKCRDKKIKEEIWTKHEELSIVSIENTDAARQELQVECGMGSHCGPYREAYNINILLYKAGYGSVSCYDHERLVIF